jgi:hypothetical protein
LFSVRSFSSDFPPFHPRPLSSFLFPIFCLIFLHPLIFNRHLISLSSFPQSIFIIFLSCFHPFQFPFSIIFSFFSPFLVPSPSFPSLRIYPLLLLSFLVFILLLSLLVSLLFFRCHYHLKYFRPKALARSLLLLFLIVPFLLHLFFLLLRSSPQCSDQHIRELRLSKQQSGASARVSRKINSFLDIPQRASKLGNRMAVAS